MKIAVIGAGISGLTIARMFKENGDDVTVYEISSKLGGACADTWDRQAMCYVSDFGPHILHFSNESKAAEDFLLNVTKLTPYIHSVMALGNSGFTMWPPTNSHETLHAYLNPNKTFFDEYISSYSKKMWGKQWESIKSSVLTRFKSKDHYNTEFFEGQNSYIPSNGYAKLFKDLASGINIKLNENNPLSFYAFNYDLVICTAAIDQMFDYIYGKLDWQGIDFTFKTIQTNGSNLLPTATVNLNTHPKYTRCTEYNQFRGIPTARLSNSRVIGFEEPAKNNKLYPINNNKNAKLLARYQIRASKAFKNVHFLGRLGEYKYYDMDKAIKAAMDCFYEIDNKRRLYNGRNNPDTD